MGHVSPLSCPGLGRKSESGLLGFAAGVMAALAVLDILVPVVATAGATCGGPRVAVAAFLGGVAFVEALGRCVAEADVSRLFPESVDALPTLSSSEGASPKAGTVAEARRKATRAAALVSLALACHNGQEKGAKFPTSKAPISVDFHSFWLIFGRVIISRNGLEA